MLEHAWHVLLRGSVLAAFLLLPGLSLAEAALTESELIDIWNDETLDVPTVSNEGHCHTFASELAEHVEATVQGSITWDDGSGAEGEKKCIFVLRFSEASGEPVLFSPSHNERAEPRHVYIEGGYEDYEVMFYRAGKGNSPNNLQRVEMVGTGGSQCLTPSGETFHGPSPCNPDLGHGRHAGDPKVPGQAAGRGGAGAPARADDPPGGGRPSNPGAPGNGRGRD